MNNWENFFLLLAYSITTEDFKRFQNWMEENFLRKVMRTGHFTAGVGKLPDPSIIGSRGLAGVIYTLKPKSLEDLRSFEDEDLPRLSSLFHEEWVEFIRRGKLTQLYYLRGLEHEILNIDLTTKSQAV